jgi:iron(III) transport system substrate-binding protein
MIRALLVSFLVVLTGCAKREYVVLYTSQDQFYAEPILKEFTAATGIEVRAVFDTESAKTAALAHRLRAEKSNPQCDVFWSNEEMHARLLVRDGALDSNKVLTVGYRTRELVINTNLMKIADAPRSLLELTNSKWRGKVALAYPLFGTTSTHFIALRQHWGEAQWRQWCEALVANEARIVDGNSVVVRLVGAGEAVIGLTDSDDIAAGVRQALPIARVEDLKETLVIPNTLALTTGTPRPQLALSLVGFLASRETLERLVSLGALAGVESGTTRKELTIDWSDADLDAMNEVLKTIFLRS